MNAHEYGRSVGEHADRLWERAGRRREALTDIAVEVLAERTPPEGLDHQTLLEEALTAPLVEQEDLKANFGQPPLTLYAGDDFTLDALYWFDSTTAVHEHAFAGAFRVLHGGSLHTPYHFEVGDARSEQVVLGELRAGESELLREGDVRPIAYGTGMIHSLFHLESPSVTLVLRDRVPGGGVQLRYHAPGLGIESPIRDPVLVRRLQVLQALDAIDKNSALEGALALISRGDLLVGFHVLLHWNWFHDRGERLDAVANRLMQRHGASVGFVPELIAEERRQFSIRQRRKMLQAPEHRLFLALLLTVSRTEDMRRIVGRMFPARDPLDVLVDWVKDLSSPQLRGISGLRVDTEDEDALRAVLAESGALTTLSRRLQEPELLSRALSS